jgi:arginyl-tRNA--protein-N-Asp/Glu arginylyltransferase
MPQFPNFFFLPQIVELCLVCYGFVYLIYDPQFLSGMEMGKYAIVCYIQSIFTVQS